MIEELAVGAQFKLPYVHVVVNNSYLGLIRQAQRGFDMDYCVQLAFDNINAPELEGYGVDHVAVAEGLGCKALRVFKPEDIAGALKQAQALAAEHQVPVVVEMILERVTNIAKSSPRAVRTRPPPSRRSTEASTDDPLTDHQEKNNAEIRRESDDALQRSPVPRPLCGGVERGLRGSRIPVSVSVFDQRSQSARAGQRLADRLAQPARR
jgi:TPP-dependent pyruvate/acetoin dehydrogenase alpha subunit